MKRVTLQFDFEDDDFKEFLDQDDVQGDLREWVFAEMCQNQGFGFLVDCSVTEA